jgi:DNA-binding transcriptional LysR family regulator
MAEFKPRDFSDIWALVAVVECGSFSEAARRMGSNKASVSKQVARLERALDTRLLHRSTRRVSLTEAGREIYHHATRMTEEARAIEAKLAGLQERPGGTLRVSTSAALGIAHIAGLLPGFQQRYPEVKVALSLSDRYVDLVEDGFDLALRLAFEIDLMSAVARPIAPLNYVLAASPAYLREYGAPSGIDDLPAHRCLAFGEPGMPVAWTLHVDGQTTVRKMQAAVTVNSSLALRAAMLAGGGIALLPTYVVGQDIERGDAVHVLPGVEPEGASGTRMYAVYLRNRFLPQKVRVFIDYLTEQLGDTPYWDRFLAAQRFVQET